MLVVVQLSGGNDALNTLVPLDGRYHDARPSLAVADGGLVAMTGTTVYGLHPSFASWKPLLAAGQVAALAGIGFEHPDRSHFVALADWWAGAGDRPGQPPDGWAATSMPRRPGTTRRCEPWPSVAEPRR